MGISKLSISFSISKPQSSSFTTVVEDYTVTFKFNIIIISENLFIFHLVPHNKLKTITTGSFPALFIKIDCHKGTPISMKDLKIYGCDPDQAGQQFEMQS